MPFDRSHSILQMTSPLGGDVLIATAVSGYEAISQPFSYRVQMVSEQGGITADSVLRKPGCVILRRDDDTARYFHGVFQEFAAAGESRPNIYAYHAVLVPGFWFLSQTIDCRVFQDKRANEIIQQMLDDAQVAPVEFRLHDQPPKRDYTVQFNETDLQFATRLMEETGLFYFFEHSEDQHTLVIADSNDAFRDLPNANLRFNANIRAEDVLTSWHRPEATTHGQVALKDYDPRQPDKLLYYNDLSTLPVAGKPSRDVFMWPAATHDQGIVTNRSKLMIEAAQASVSTSSGAGSFRPMAVGGRFTLQSDDAGSSTYVVRWMTFEAIDESWTTEGAPAFYANSFESFPTTVPWRQPFSVARPDMGSVHSAIVLGPAGEEIYTDEYGRVKVQFFWDHRQEATANQAVWARVIQPWAGGGFGTQFIPRVGMEVAVAFVDGDADRPIVLGGLYNGHQMPIYPPGQKTKSGLRTRSTLKGGTDEFNELTFDDEKGSEQVFLQAQKDMRVKVKHDQTLSVGHDRTVDVKNAESITVGEGRTTVVSDKDDSLTVRQGDLSIEVSEGKATITAMQSIELKVGGSSIRIDQTGITLTAMVIQVNGQMSVSINAPMTSVNGDGMVRITGGVVEIN